ncbi:MAG: glutamate cyclase domain-containing protein [Planctomycetaceae bacterium]
MIPQLIAEFESLIRRDPARRGLIGSEEAFGPLCRGHLARAASELANAASHVAIVTGFFVPHGCPPAAETDGPPGALLLAAALKATGIRATVITDTNCAPAVMAAADATGVSRTDVLVAPLGDCGWIDAFFSSDIGKSLTHLIAIERVGPSHTPQSLQTQPGGSADLPALFLEQVPVDSHNRCHNMRGDVIDNYCAELHRLFDEGRERYPNLKTIGIGDGANEIGMGSIPWEDLVRRLPGDHAVRIPCRVATDWTIVAGTSNWGGYALAAATLLLRGRADFLQPWDADHELQVIEHMVANGPAVDGVTGRQEPTVDGLPFPTYIQPWEGIRRALGFEK